MQNFTRALGLCVGGLLLGTAPAYAATVVLSYDQEFSGGQAPAGGTPWMVSTFSASPTTYTIGGTTYDAVRLTIDLSMLQSGAFISETDFNVNPSLNPANLSFHFVSGNANANIAPSLATDGFKAGGDGYYDISLGFATAANQRFAAGTQAVFDISATDVLTAALLSPEAFAFLSTPAGGNGPFYAATHVQGSRGPCVGGGCGGNGWIAATTVVPLPAAAWLLGSGLAGLGAFVRRQRRAA
jgi:hypothetical protein